MSLTVRLSPKTERALDALAKRRRLSHSDVVREAIERYGADADDGGSGRPYDAWLDVIGVISLGVRDVSRTTGELFTAVLANGPVRGVLVDGGLLGALIDRANPAHEACVAALKTLRDPLVTVWPAFTETMYLLGQSWHGQRASGAGSKPMPSRWRYSMIRRAADAGVDGEVS